MIVKMEFTVILSVSCCIFSLFPFLKSSDAAINYIPIPKMCAVPHHDYFNLTTVTWYFYLKQPDCLPIHDGDVLKNVSGCLVYMKFCYPLALMGSACHNSSVCQLSSLGSLSLGAYKKYPFVESHDSPDEFGAYLANGTNYYTQTNATCNLSTLVNFRCNHSVPWPDDIVATTLNQAPDPWLVEYNANTCEMTYSFDFAGACPWRTRKRSYLSVGSVLLLIFSTTLALYLILGCLLNYAKGKSGSELIPHFSFWSMLYVYIIEGVKFTFCRDRTSVRAVAYAPIE